MSRILILANDNSTIFNFRRELLSRLIDEGYEVIISVPNHQRNVEFEKMGCSVDEINLSRSGTNPIREFALIKSYRSQIKRINPDLVLTYTAKPNIYGSLVCQKLNIPYINNITGLGANFQGDNLIKRIMLTLQKWAYRKSQCVFFQNESNKTYFEQLKIVVSNSRLLPGSGVNLQLHKFEHYPKDDKTIRFILVSRIRKDKGYDEFFSSVKSLTEMYSNIEFHIVGWFEDEKYRGIIEEMVEKYPVIYHGNQSQEKVHELIANCHCLIHPSHHEGLANVLLEAAATGRPCLASNIPGCKETIDDGITGFLFKVKDTECLSEAIIKFLKLSQFERKEMGLLSRRKIEKEFDRQIVVNTYINKIEELLNKHTGEHKNVAI